MKTRSRVRRGKDRAIFRKTAVRKNVKNLPGHAISRGGTCL